MRRSPADSTNRSLAAFGKLQHIRLKSFILSPFIDERDVEQLVRDILDARQALDAAAPE